MAIDGGTVGSRIRAAREAMGLTQKQLAERLASAVPTVSNSAQNISNYERDVYGPAADALLGLAQVLGLSEEWLLHGIAAKQKYPSGASSSAVVASDDEEDLPNGLAAWAGQRLARGAPVTRERLRTMARTGFRFGESKSWDRVYELVLEDEKQNERPLSEEERKAKAKAEALGAKTLLHPPRTRK